MIDSAAISPPSDEPIIFRSYSDSKDFKGNMSIL